MIARKTATPRRAEHYPKELAFHIQFHAAAVQHLVLGHATETRNHKPAGPILAGSTNRSKKIKSRGRDAPEPAPADDPCPLSAAEKQRK
jgi:hypothetical protein